jgi:cell division septation protein DedD
MKYFTAIVIALLLIVGLEANAQSAEIRNYLRMVAQGKIQEVKKVLPDLLADYPDDPGVMLLHGVVIEDGYKAVEKYKKILAEFPESEWADDACWRIVQFYAVVGDTTNAKKELENYRKKYPTSDFLIAATDVVKSSVSFARKDSRSSKHDQAEPNESTEKKKLTKPAKAVKHEESEEKHTEKAESPKEKKAIEKPAKKTEEPKTQTHATKGKYGLQVGIYSTQDAAKAEVERFRSLRMIASIYPKKVDDVTMHAVVIGDYNSKESAESARSMVQGQCKCLPILFEK